MSRTTYFSDESVTLYHGDAIEILQTLDDGSLDCCVTSPPYYGLRDYGHEGQYGLEDSPGAYVENMRTLFAEVRRVLTDNGTLWLNIGDSYASASSTGKQGSSGQRAARTFTAEDMQNRGDLPPKNMLGIPWRVAFTLQADGWILRNAIVWHKPNAMPESVTDRLSSDYEYVFLFTKSRRYWFDLDAIREQLARPEALGTVTIGGLTTGEGKTGSSYRTAGGMPNTWGSKKTPRKPDEPFKLGTGRTDGGYRGTHDNGRNPGSVWNISTSPFSEAHFAVMPVALAARCIQAGCPPKRCRECGHTPTPIIERGKGHPRERTNRDEIGSPSGVNNLSGKQHAAWKAQHPDTFHGWTDCGHQNNHAAAVLDPFSGSGTTGLAAAQLGRRYVGIDLSRDYLDLSLRTRLGQMALLDDEVDP